MDATNLLLYSVATLVSLIFIYKIWPKKIVMGAPEPGRAWPVIGHLHLLRITPLHRTLASLSDQYGPIFLLRLGPQRALVVSNTELAKECLTINDQAFASRPKFLVAKYLGYDSAVIGLAPYGHYWRELRKISTLELLSSRRLELLKHVRLKEVDSLMKDLFTDHENVKPLEMKHRISLMSMNIVLRMVTGKRFTGEYKEAKEMTELAEELAHAFGLLTPADVVPWLEWLDLGGHLKYMKELSKKMDKIVDGWLTEHRQKRDSDDLGSHDFIDVLISQVEDGHLSDTYDSDIIIKSMAMSMILAGTDTTSDTLVWAVSLLLNHPHELKKAQEELDLQVGQERLVDDSDIAKLPYVQAILKETMRLYPAGPLLIPHHSTEPVKVGGYQIPEGTSLYVNVWKIHRDPKTWSEPEEFKPSRFLTERKEIDFNGKSFEFMPFGFGRRSCPGYALGLQVALLTLARLLQGFEWRTPMGDPVDMSEGSGLAMPKATPLHVHVQPRLPPHLYY